MIVIRFDAQVAVTPVGKLVAVPIPVASVVACVILVNAVSIHNVGVLDGAAAALSGVTVTATVVALLSQGLTICVT